MPLDPVVAAIHIRFQNHGWQSEEQIVDALKWVAPRSQIQRALHNGAIAQIFTTWIVGHELRHGLLHWPNAPERKLIDENPR